ncbi:MAG: sodium:dicarboxylate symporter, partial [Novosphingobium sp. 16-62-11]
MTLPPSENSSNPASTSAAMTLPPIAQVPAVWTFLGLITGLAGGLFVAFAAPSALPLVETWVKPIGEMWLRALQATIVPLVAALLFTGVTQTVATASAGALARRSLGLFLAVLTFSAGAALVVTPALIALIPIPADAGAALRQTLSGKDAGPVPGIADFLRSIVPTNVIDAAANDRILPLILFVSVFALAVGRLAGPQREVMTTFFAALASAMLVVIGWVLALAPIGVFALSMA